MSKYMNSNPLNQHNAPLAVSSKDIQGLNTGTGNMYQGQGGRAFVQGGGGASQFYSADIAGPQNAYARGSYHPVTIGSNAVVTRGGRRRRNTGSKRKHRRSSKKCKCDIITGVGGRRRHRSHSRSRTCHIKNCKCICHSRSHSRSRRVKQRGGNAGYSIAGPDTGINKFSSALANPASHTAYNSCHPVA
jgi:hypothetical protein